MDYRFIITVCLLFLSHFAMGQEVYSISGKSIYELKNQNLPAFTFSQTTIHLHTLNESSTPTKLPPLSQQMLAPYHVDDLAFFCRLEVKLEKKIGLPFKFRLGEVQYTEKMEGKY